MRAALAGGRDVRLLARDPNRAESGLRDLVGDDADRVEVVSGDVTDAGRMAELLDGADEVVHAAGSVTLTGVDAALVESVNVGGTRNVVAAAAERGMGGIVHVSSVAVLFPPDTPTISADTAIAAPRGDYGRTKAMAEHEVRALQDDGAPITILYPGGVLGAPAWGRLGESATAVEFACKRGVVPMTPGGWSIVDVRDVADATIAALDGVGAGGRHVLGGVFMDMSEMADRLSGMSDPRFDRSVVFLCLGGGLPASPRCGAGRREDFPGSPPLFPARLPVPPAGYANSADARLRPCWQSRSVP